MVNLKFYSHYFIFQVDNSVRVMGYKRWPQYKDWCDIFGNDGQREIEWRLLEAMNDVLNMIVS